MIEHRAPDGWAEWIRGAAVPPPTPRVHTSKCGSFRGSEKAVSKHEIHCHKCALKYAGRTP